MTELEKKVIDRAHQLLASGEVEKVVGWKKGEFYFDPVLATFHNFDELKDFTYNDFCGANLSKYLIEESKNSGKIGVFLKPCDTFSFNELCKENRLKRENFFVIGVECQGKIDNDKLLDMGIDGVTEEIFNGEEVLLKTIFGDKKTDKDHSLYERCLTCKGKRFAVADDMVQVDDMSEKPHDRFSKVRELEAMTPNERFAFWRSQLSKCIRCNACRNVCPACTCTNCVFDNHDSNISAKSNDDRFEEQLFHIIRAFHVAGRCTDCGECSRVCPQRIPLHLLNRKFIKDINTFYGEYQAGETIDGKTPVTEYSKTDIEPNNAVKGDNK